jgi:hypothetical protein
MAQEVRISFAWDAQDESQLSVAVGETVMVDANADTSSGWAYCRNAAGHEGTARLWLRSFCPWARLERSDCIYLIIPSLVLNLFGSFLFLLFFLLWLRAPGYIPANYIDKNAPTTTVSTSASAAAASQLEFDANKGGRHLANAAVIALGLGGANEASSSRPAAPASSSADAAAAARHRRTESSLRRTAAAAAAASSGDLSKTNAMLAGGAAAPAAKDDSSKKKIKYAFTHSRNVSSSNQSVC